MVGEIRAAEPANFSRTASGLVADWPSEDLGTSNRSTHLTADCNRMIQPHHDGGREHRGRTGIARRVAIGHGRMRKQGPVLPPPFSNIIEKGLGAKAGMLARSAGKDFSVTAGHENPVVCQHGAGTGRPDTGFRQV